MATLTFHGAAETVTGSKYLLEADSARVLIDCGLFQGLKELRLRNWDRLPFDPRALDAVVLTHAHIDHLGFLPRVVKYGFRSSVFATPATVDLAEIMLYDSARNQEDDAEYANRKHFSKHHPALALYDADDVTRTLKLLRPVVREQWFQAAGPIWCRFHDAGHLLGSAMIEVEIRNRPKPLRVLFSGDVGRYNAPLYHDPQPPPPCDYLICESTYGNREHPEGDAFEALARSVHRAIERGGVMLVPAFAVGRAQQLMYLLHVLIGQGRIPPLDIYLDSPMSVKANQVYIQHCQEQDLVEAAQSRAGNGLSAKNVHLVSTVQESKAINSVRDHAVIIASSGMMTGGRVLHHLRQRLGDSRNTVLLGGYQAAGTRGRALQEGARFIRIHGQDVSVRAAIESISELSGHAGHSELIRWLAPLAKPKKAFFTHGEQVCAQAMADELYATRGWNTVVPRMAESFELE